MPKYVLAPVVITTMLLSVITISFTYPDEPKHIDPLVHVSVIVCVCCLFLRMFDFM